MNTVERGREEKKESEGDFGRVAAACFWTVTDKLIGPYNSSKKNL